MMSHCDSVAERVALGEPLAELDEHVSTCERCLRLVAVTGSLRSTRQAVDPGLGFSARMTVGAQQRIVVRRRRRIAAGLATAVAAGTLGVFVLARDPSAQQEQPQPALAEQPKTDELTTLDEPELEMLVDVADTKRSRRLSAHWARIQRPLQPYKKLVMEAPEGDLE